MLLIYIYIYIYIYICIYTGLRGKKAFPAETGSLSLRVYDLDNRL